MEMKKQVAANLSCSPEHHELDELLQTLEQGTNWDGRPILKYQCFWCPSFFLRPLLSAQKHFKSKDTDIILATMPKSGTTWLKALSFSIANRHTYPVHQALYSLLVLTHLRLLSSLIFIVTKKITTSSTSPVQESSQPTSIPDSIRGSGSKIIYICRNPLDQFISYRHFLLESKFGKDTIPSELDESFDKGVHLYGPCLDHMLGYWNAHLENPDKVLFLKYEDLKEDIGSNVRKIGAFMGCPFTLEEESQGLVEEIARPCSFDNLKNMEVNKPGSFGVNGVMNSSFFRKGQVGDWANYLTPAMAERMKKLIETRFQGSGLTFNI